MLRWQEVRSGPPLDLCLNRAGKIYWSIGFLTSLGSLIYGSPAAVILYGRGSRRRIKHRWWFTFLYIGRGSRAPIPILSCTASFCQCLWLPTSETVAQMSWAYQPFSARVKDLLLEIEHIPDTVNGAKNCGYICHRLIYSPSAKWTQYLKES